MEKPTYQQFQQALGNIIIRWALAEERFRLLLSATAGLPEREGHIIFNKVSGINQRGLLLQLGSLRHSEAAQEDLAFCAKLHDINSKNRNMFAHGHIGFGHVGLEEPYAQFIKLQSRKRLYNEMWEMPFSDVIRVAQQITEFSNYVAFMTMHIPDDLPKGNGSYAGHAHRPPMPVDYVKNGFDLDEMMKR